MTKVTIKNEKFLTMKQSLDKLNTMDLPIVTSLNVVKNFKNIQTCSEAFFEVRNNLFKKYGEELTDGDAKGQIQIKPENLEAFNEEYSVLLEQEATLTIDLISSKENFPNVTPKFIMDLDFMFS